jgi:hypothetical protein
MTRRQHPAQEPLFEIAPVRVRARRGVDRQIREQRKLGQLEPVDEGVIAVLRDWSDTLDAARAAGDSAFTLSNGYAKLLDHMRLLRGDPVYVTSSIADDELAVLVAAIRDAARPDT